ncbi:TPA: hypothetical protein DEP58_03720 [Patescibacteria group bacterium]|nr:MAG: 5''''-methylthioadenosine/S-adenosylhomocysteine nucleosidase [Parcubacteria group bacterium GW2011_GWD2_42_14]HCC05382.1 hypothetical protein [Patescibacteria group bacterium]
MKKLLQLFTGIVLLGTLGFFMLRETLPPCSDEIISTTYIAVVTAIALESEPFKDLLEGNETCTSGGIAYTVGNLEGKNILMFLSGVGPDEVEKVIRQTLTTFTIDRVVFSGVAGGVDTALQLGDTVVAREWLDVRTGERVTTDADLIKKMEQFEGVRVVPLGATVDSFVSDRTTLPNGVSVVDMETATIALLAKEFGVPFLAFRSASDFADDGGTDATFRIAAEASASATVRFILESELN